MASILANVNIAVVEYLNRVGQYESFFEAICRTAPFVIIAQWGLWKCWDGAPSFMLAWAFFTGGNLALRLVSNQWLVGEGLNWKSALGVAVVAGGVALVKVGAR